ncbi:MAG: hypothetical protein ABFS21_05395 [Actinomycetota bacterium]
MFRILLGIGLIVVAGIGTITSFGSSWAGGTYVVWFGGFVAGGLIARRGLRRYSAWKRHRQQTTEPRNPAL